MTKSDFLSIFTSYRDSLFLWWLTDNETKSESIYNDKELVDVLENSVIYFHSISIYLWDGYDPINDEVDFHKKYKQYIYKYWQDDHYYYCSDGSKDHSCYSSVLGPSFEKPYPFVEDSGDVSSL